MASGLIKAEYKTAVGRLGLRRFLSVKNGYEQKTCFPMVAIIGLERIHWLFAVTGL